jgi:hypothetical protein
MPEPSPLHPVSRQHLDVMTDGVGIMQHAIGSRPDPGHGYCVDDVARALQVDLLHGRELGWPAVGDRARHGLDFLAEAFDDATGRFRNFRSVDGSWVDGIGSEDCHGRAFHALGDVIADAPDVRMVEAATALFDKALPAALGLTALRAQASVLLGCAARLGAAPDPATTDACRPLAVEFLARFPSDGDSTWPWPEPRLTYENALPARALIVAGQTFGSQAMIDAGLRVIDWLIEVQTTTDGHLSPIGNGFWPRDGHKARFDQQPIEATALLLAAESAYRVTGYDRHRNAMERAYAWFLGKNDLGADVADPLRGAGYDGLTAHGVNTNQGAESTLMWLIAAEHIRMLRPGHPAAPDRIVAPRRTMASPRNIASLVASRP